MPRHHIVNTWKMTGQVKLVSHTKHLICSYYTRIWGDLAKSIRLSLSWQTTIWTDSLNSKLIQTDREDAIYFCHLAESSSYILRMHRLLPGLTHSRSSFAGVDFRPHDDFIRSSSKFRERPHPMPERKCGIFFTICLNATGSIAWLFFKEEI